MQFIQQADRWLKKKNLFCVFSIPGSYLHFSSFKVVVPERFCSFWNQDIFIGNFISQLFHQQQHYQTKPKGLIYWTCWSNNVKDVMWFFWTLLGKGLSLILVVMYFWGALSSLSSCSLVSFIEVLVVKMLISAFIPSFGGYAWKQFSTRNQLQYHVTARSICFECYAEIKLRVWNWSFIEIHLLLRFTNSYSGIFFFFWLVLLYISCWSLLNLFWLVQKRYEDIPVLGQRPSEEWMSGIRLN